MNMRKVVKEKLEPQLKDSEGKVHKERLGHRTADFSQQIQILVDDIQVLTDIDIFPLIKMGTF